jgi:hypothetical protein
MGWCPNSYTMNAKTSGNRTDISDISDSDPPQPGTTPAFLVTQHWMTATALVILFATFFVGGNLWWPIFVFALLVIFVVIHIRTLQTQESA